MVKMPVNIIEIQKSPSGFSAKTQKSGANPAENIMVIHFPFR